MNQFGAGNLTNRERRPADLRADSGQLSRQP